MVSLPSETSEQSTLLHHHLENSLRQNQTTPWVVAMATVGHMHVRYTHMSLRCRFSDDAVLMLRPCHLMRSGFVILRWSLQASFRRHYCKTVKSVSSIFLLSIHTAHDSTGNLATWRGAAFTIHESKCVVVVIIINNRGIEAIPGLFGLKLLAPELLFFLNFSTPCI